MDDEGSCVRGQNQEKANQGRGDLEMFDRVMWMKKRNEERKDKGSCSG